MADTLLWRWDESCPWKWSGLEHCWAVKECWMGLPSPSNISVLPGLSAGKTSPENGLCTSGFGDTLPYNRKRGLGHVFKGYLVVWKINWERLQLHIIRRIATNSRVSMSFAPLWPDINFSSFLMQLWSGILFQCSPILSTLKTCFGKYAPSLVISQSVSGDSQAYHVVLTALPLTFNVLKADASLIPV